MFDLIFIGTGVCGMTQQVTNYLKVRLKLWQGKSYLPVRAMPKRYRKISNQ